MIKKNSYLVICLDRALGSILNKSDQITKMPNVALSNNVYKLSSCAISLFIRKQSRFVRVTDFARLRTQNYMLEKRL